MSHPTRRLTEIEFKLRQSIVEGGSPRLQALIRLCHLRVERTDNSVVAKIFPVNTIVGSKTLKLLADEVRLLGQPLGIDDCKIDSRANNVHLVVREGSND